MSIYEKIIKKVKTNSEYGDFVKYISKDYSKYTNYQEKDYLPFPFEGFATKAIHVGSEPEKIHGSVNTPIHMSTTFLQKSPNEPMSEFVYGRCGNPTRQAFEQCIAEVEFGKYGIAFGSGLGAVSCVLHLFQPGDHIICCDDAYGGTQRYLRNYTTKAHQIEVNYVDTTDIENVKKALKKNTALVWLESPTNPTLKTSDIQAISDLVHEYKKDIVVVVDNTFLSPYLCSPILLGVDVVMHSVTKYIGGHSDILMGSLVTNNKDLYDKMNFAAKTIGASPSAFDCYMALRGMKSLESRIKIHCYNAYCLAHYLQDHEKVQKVFYSGLPDNPQRELILKQQRGFGGMVSFQIKGGLEEATQFMKNLKIFALAESLGGVESLANLPAVMTHGGVPKEHRELCGITDGFIRLSVGIENINDIIADIEQALEKVKVQ